MSFSPKLLIGLTQQNAEALVAKMGFLCRITAIDGKYQVVTADINPKRVNIELKNGVVVNAAQG